MINTKWGIHARCSNKFHKEQAVYNYGWFEICRYCNVRQKIRERLQEFGARFYVPDSSKYKGLIRQREKDLLFNTVDLIYAYGVSKIVYVRENNNNSGFFQRSLRDFQADFTVDNAKNNQEAEDILDEKKSGK